MTDYTLKTPAQIQASNPVTPAATDLLLLWKAGAMGGATVQQLADLIIGLISDGAPGALDTLNELAAALGDDANFAATVTTALAGKAALAHTHAIADVTGLQTALDAASLTPGDIRLSFDAAPRSNEVELDGSTITGGETSFPDVATRYPWMVSSGNIILPNTRGRFLRVWAHGSSNDPDRASRTARAGDGQTGDYPGTYQSHAVQDHTHRPAARSGVAGTEMGNSYTAGSAAANGTTGGMISGNSSTETRGINVAISAYMRVI